MVEMLEETQLHESSEMLNKKTAKQSWRLLKNVLKASFLFKNQDVKVISDLDELVEEVRSSPTKICLNKQLTLTDKVICDHKAGEMLMILIQRSTSDDLVEIEKLIENDPRKFAVNKTSPDSFVNKAWVNGIRPIYEACKNGYMNTVQLLLDYGANPHFFSLLGDKEKENSLNVACRWNHVHVIQVLLNSSVWTAAEIKSAMKVTKKVCVLDMLKAHSVKHKEQYRKD